MTEFDHKQNLIRDMLAENGLEALLLRDVSSFAWATCGAASYVINTATTDSVLVGVSQNEVLTTIEGWPTLSIPVGDKVVERPAILEVD